MNQMIPAKEVRQIRILLIIAALAGVLAIGFTAYSNSQHPDNPFVYRQGAPL